MDDFTNTANELTETELAEVTGGLPWNYDWANYDWRDAVIEALP
ncbi:bacteriocin [Herbidospora daliensis]|nr:bacteriocin [Herbidospora daliensis]